METAQIAAHLKHNITPAMASRVSQPKDTHHSRCFWETTYVSPLGRSYSRCTGTFGSVDCDVNLAGGNRRWLQPGVFSVVIQGLIIDAHSIVSTARLTTLMLQKQ